jgi:type I restriction enzyme S subunit
MLKKDNVVWVYYMLQMMNLNQYHTGAAQPGLAVKNLNTLNVIVVPYNHQKQFADFVEQTEKSKATIKQVKEKAETLKEKLMQDYFG